MLLSVAERLTTLESLLSTGQNPSAAPSVLQLPIGQFLDPALYAREVALLRQRPLPIALGAEMKNCGDVVSRTLLGVPLIAVRGADGVARVFRNACRHRGTQLLEEDSCGHAKALVCPYHAWTFALDGQLTHIPEEDQGFPGIDKKTMGLTPVESTERAGHIWVWLSGERNADEACDQVWDDLDSLPFIAGTPFHAENSLVKANWKVVLHGFLESYHFRMAHRNSANRYYVPNRMLTEFVGDHQRTTLPMVSLVEQFEKIPREKHEFWPHVNMVYHLFPCAFFFVVKDHAGFIHFVPEGVDKTRVRSWVVVPDSIQKPKEYWQWNSDFFFKVMEEDLRIAESVQRGLAAAASTHFPLGTFEHGIQYFEQRLALAVSGLV